MTAPATRLHKMLIIIGKVFYCVGWRFGYQANTGSWNIMS